MKKVILYCDKRSLNDATSVYLAVIKKALENSGYRLYVAHKLSEIKAFDIIFTVTERYYLQSKIRYPFIKTIYWSQGIGAEEAKMHKAGLIRIIYRYCAEFLAIRNANMLFFVSERMREYFSQNYGYKRNNYIIMPCFNKSLTSKFNVDQYILPKFIYAGGISVWQEIDILLDVYAEVEKNIPRAELTILSKEYDVFYDKIMRRGIQNFIIKYIPLKDLDEEMRKHKYGFILREDHLVNNVATPTKMNTYLANYLIPIYSNAVEDFVRNVNLGEFSIVAKCPLSASEIAKQIIEFENTVRDFSNYQNRVRDIFACHYNIKQYQDQMLEKIEQCDL